MTRTNDPNLERSRRRYWPEALLAATLAAAYFTAAAGAPAEPRDGAYCSATAKLLYSACGYEAQDGFLVTQAKCINYADAGRRAKCLADADKAKAEAAQACQAQLDSRRAGCAVLGEGRYDPSFDPKDFDSNFKHLGKPNPYFPLTIGNRWELEGGGEVNQIEVTSETKRIEGVTCIVLRDLVYKKGMLAEATDDWFAAGRDGSAWYCGEEVKDYASFAGDRPKRPELVSIAGSFKHGRNHDKAGVIMPAQARAGQVYREEFSLGNAEDVSEVLSVSYAYGEDPVLDAYVPSDLAQRLCAARDCLVTRNTSLLEPGLYALKYYARGIGFFLEIKPDDGETLQLVDCNFDARCTGLRKR